MFSRLVVDDAFVNNFINTFYLDCTDVLEVIINKPKGLKVAKEDQMLKGSMVNGLMVDRLDG